MAATPGPRRRDPPKRTCRSIKRSAGESAQPGIVAINGTSEHGRIGNRTSGGFRMENRIETGSCFCGAIAAEMHGEPFWICYDHDDDCRRAIGREDALDRWGQLEVCGIAADVLAVTPEGQERPVLLAARLDGVTNGARPTGFGAREAELTPRNQARSPSR